MGIQSQLIISRIPAYTVSNQIANCSINSNQKKWINPSTKTNNIMPSICPNCGYWSPNHRQNCQERGKICKTCCIANRFAKFCSKLKNPIKLKPRVNNVDDISSEAATVGTYATVEMHIIQIDSILRKLNSYDANYDSNYDDLDDNCVAVITDDNHLREVEPVYMQMQIGNTAD